MSAAQSDLTAPQYGYDIVVGTTVASINSTLKQYIAEVKQPEFTICYISNGQGGLTQIPYATLIANAKNSDPFNIGSNTDPATNSDIQNLVAAGFVTAFQARIGLPPGIAPAEVAPVVIFDTVHSKILYNQLCSAFRVIEYTPQNGNTPASWMDQSQPQGAPWIFQASVALNIATTTEYSQLPANVQQQITNLGSTAFSVQQILFNLQVGALEAAPVLTGVPPASNIVQCLQNDFVGAYFATMQQNGQPLLGCAIKQSAPDNSTLALTDLQLQINPYVVNGQPVSDPSQDQPQLYALNYLCSVNGDALPLPALFTWNWVDAQDNNNTIGDGVIAINRSTFATWLAQQLASGLTDMCMVPAPYVMNDQTFNGVGFTIGPSQQFQLVPPAPAGADGFFHVLTAAYSKVGNPASEWVFVSYMSINCTYSVNSDVYFGNNQGVPEIKMVTSNNAWVSINVEGGVTQGNFAAYTSTMVFQLAVDGNGDLLVSSVPPPPPPPPTDVSQQPDVSWISEGVTLGEVNGIVSDIQTKVQGMIGAFLNISNLGIQSTLNAPKAWIFPGGNTFAFKNLAFSNSGDLVAEITYVDPS